MSNLVSYFTLISLVQLQFSTHAACKNDRYLAFKTVGLHCQTPTLIYNAYAPSKEAVHTIFMMIFGLTRPGREPTTYTLTTKPSRRGLTWETGITHFRFIKACTFSVVSGRSLYIMGKFGQVKWDIILEM